MIAVVDYGVGNLFSLTSSLKKAGADVTVTSDPCEIKRADKILLPGVGAFKDARERLAERSLDTLICSEAAAGKKIFGICLGMQMLFEESHEYGVHRGLGLLRGSVVGMQGRIPNGLKIPHIGWNALSFKRTHPVFKYVKDGDFVYFVHSYFASECEESVAATAEYGIEITAAVGLGNIAGAQFHPEKSGDVGIAILRGFAEW